MVEIINKGIFYNSDKNAFAEKYDEGIDACRKNTMAMGILNSHNTSGNDKKLKLKFDSLASHDITYVNLIQTARAIGMTEFPVPYVLTNCHNSLSAVSGTINEDDHMYGLSAAKKYGGIYVPPHLAVIHTYMREMMSGCGKMILGSDSHTRYGALGTMAIGEGAPELVKQLVGRTYDIDMPEIIGVYLEGTPKNSVGPHDVALALIGAVFGNGFVKNKILEFFGPGIKNLPVEFRNGIDVMTAETTCLSSIWITDETVKDYYRIHGRIEDYKAINQTGVAYYDGFVKIDLSKVECMIAMPFHPSNVYTINEVNANLSDIINQVEKTAKEQLEMPNIKFSLKEKIIDGKFKTDQGIIAGCAGGIYDNICIASNIMKDKSIDDHEFSLSVYPSSQAVNLAIVRNGVAESLMKCGAVLRTAFCGPCFGAGDVPANNSFSIRHSTRNFPNREGSIPRDGQIASVALMDARSIAATAGNGGFLTAASTLDVDCNIEKFTFDNTIYEKRVYNGYTKGEIDVNLRFGPNITDWPKISPLPDNLLLKMCCVITDPVTTTDELIPSGETSSYRSNPQRLAEYTLSRKEPEYVGRAKKIRLAEQMRIDGKSYEEIFATVNELSNIAEKLNAELKCDISVNTGFGSVIYANKPGDGSAREQAASCQRVLGGGANIAREYATKRYHSNLINWGIVPFIYSADEMPFNVNQYVYIPNIKEAVEQEKNEVKAYIVENGVKEITLRLPKLTSDEKAIVLAGCLMNSYSAH